MHRLLFLNVGWMAKYEGLKGDTIIGGGEYVLSHGYGHEILNFQPYRDRMYGFARTPHSSIKIEKLGAAKGAESVGNVLAVWVAKSRIVGWYKDATVFREVQDPPKHSGRTYKGDPIGYNLAADASNCKLLDPDGRNFLIPRSQKQEGAMGRYLWYADGSQNRLIREKVLRYVAAGGKLAEGSTRRASKLGGARQPDIYKRQKIEKNAIKVTTAHFKRMEYEVNSVEGDNVGWDLEALHRYSGNQLKLEVKGLSGSQVCVEMTRQEYEMMRKHKKDYRVCVVTRALEEQARRLWVFTYNEISKAWVDQNDRPIQIKEVISARILAG